MRTLLCKGGLCGLCSGHNCLGVIRGDRNGSLVLTVGRRESWRVLTACTADTQPWTWLCGCRTMGERAQQPLREQLSDCSGSGDLLDAIVAMTQVRPDLGPGQAAWLLSPGCQALWGAAHFCLATSLGLQVPPQLLVQLIWVTTQVCWWLCEVSNWGLAQQGTQQWAGYAKHHIRIYV